MRAGAAHLGVAGGAISKREAFAQDVVGVPELEEEILGSAFVGGGYWVATSGNVTDEIWKKYIEDQRPRSGMRAHKRRALPLELPQDIR